MLTVLAALLTVWVFYQINMLGWSAEGLETLLYFQLLFVSTVISDSEILALVCVLSSFSLMVRCVPRVLVCTTVIHLSQKITNTMIGSLRLIDLSTDFCESLDLHCFKNSQHSNTWDRMCFLDILVKS